MTPLRSIASACLLLAAGARPLRAQQPATPPDDGSAGAGAAAVAGIVYDSIGAHPIAGAIVQLVQQGDLAHAYAARTDSTGAFRIAGVTPGRYIIGFQHPLLDSLGIEPPVRGVDVAGARTVEVELATPSSATLRAHLCPIGGPADSSGAMLGRVGDADSGDPLGGATVVAIWLEIVIDAHGLHQDRREVPVKTSDAGWYAICGLPPGDLMARAEMGPRASGFVPVTIPVRGIVRRDLTVAPDSGAVAVADTATRGGEPLFRGTARVTGVVRDDRGNPLPDAAVVVLGTRASAVSDHDGRFRLADLPAGTHTLEARKLGFMPQRVAVNLASDQTTNASVVFETRVSTLQPVTVYGKASHGGLASFLARRQRGLGTFLTRADIDRRNPIDMSDLFRMVPGLIVRPNGASGYTIESARSVGMSCSSPTVYVDGLRMDSDFTRDLDSYVPPQDVAGIEVYQSDGEAPPQYPGGGCGVILIWTGLTPP